MRWIGLTVVLDKIAKVLKIACHCPNARCRRVAQHGTRDLSELHSLVVLAIPDLAFPDT